MSLLSSQFSFHQGGGCSTVDDSYPRTSDCLICRGANTLTAMRCWKLVRHCGSQVFLFAPAVTAPVSISDRCGCRRIYLCRPRKEIEPQPCRNPCLAMHHIASERPPTHFRI